MFRFLLLISLPLLSLSASEEKTEVTLLQEQIANDFHIPLPHLIDSYGVFRKFKCALCKDIIRDKWTFIAGEINVNAPFFTDWCSIIFRIFRVDWLGKDICSGVWQKSVDKLVHHILETKENKAQSFCSHIFLCPRHPANSTLSTTVRPSQ